MSGDGAAAEFARGQEVGRVDEVLRQHGEHLAHINGSIDRTADSLEQLAAEVRGMREDMRVEKQSETVRASTLADETERRRSALADSVEANDRRFSRWQIVLGIGIGFATLVLTVLVANGVVG